MQSIRKMSENQNLPQDAHMTSENSQQKNDQNNESSSGVANVAD